MLGNNNSHLHQSPVSSAAGRAAVGAISRCKYSRSQAFKTYLKSGELKAGVTGVQAQQVCS